MARRDRDVLRATRPGRTRRRHSRAARLLATGRLTTLASSVNGFDLGVLAGAFKGMFEHEFPVVVGKDFAGVVDAIGEEVTTVDVGDAVFGVVTRPTLGQGGFAEYVVV